jgi:hypothetical protein
MPPERKMLCQPKIGRICATSWPPRKPPIVLPQNISIKSVPRRLIGL